jgi:hypothetical protein
MTPIIRKVGKGLRPKGLKRVAGRIKPKKVSKGTDAWIKAIPMGRHGSGHLQKRLWRLTSDYCRIRDWHKYDGRCVATGKKLASWNDGQGGHFKSWQKCNGMFKFELLNIHLQSAYSNSWGDKDDWKRFEKELVRRYGKGILHFIEEMNKITPLKITNEKVIEDMKWLLAELKDLPEQPPYYQRVISL